MRCGTELRQQARAIHEELAAKTRRRLRSFASGDDADVGANTFKRRSSCRFTSAATAVAISRGSYRLVRSRSAFCMDLTQPGRQPAGRQLRRRPEGAKTSIRINERMASFALDGARSRMPDQDTNHHRLLRRARRRIYVWLSRFISRRDACEREFMKPLVLSQSAWRIALRVRSRADRRSWRTARHHGDTALRTGTLFRTTPDFWMKLQDSKSTGTARI